MSLYFQRERHAIIDPIPASGKILFDRAIKSSESMPEIDPEDPTPQIPEPDFQYHPDGTIDIFRASTYIAFWHLATATGLSTDGQVFELRKRDYEAEGLSGGGEEIWIPISSSSGHFKIASSVTQSVLLVTTEEIVTYEKATVALFNCASHSVILNTHPHIKAGILLYGIGPVDSDITNLYRFVNDLYNFISYSDVHIYTCRDAPFFQSSRPGVPGGYVGLTNTPDDYQYQIGIIWSGFTYNFWLIAPNNPRNDTLNQSRMYLLRADDFVLDNGDKPLTWYQGQVTFGTLWVSRGGYTSIPVMLDNTGIYFDYTSTTTNITNMKFTQTLILSPPEPTLPAPPIG